MTNTSSVVQAEGGVPERDRLTQNTGQKPVNRAIQLADLIPQEGSASPLYELSVRALASSISETSAAVILLDERDAKKLRCGNLLDTAQLQNGL